MQISLRDYQKSAVNHVTQAFEKGINRQLIILPTGSGKTIIMAALAKQLGKRTLLLAHRHELILQAEEKFRMIWPDLECGICMADKNETMQPVVFGSVQSCCQSARLAALKENNFELLLIDEAHHTSADTYQKIIDELGFHPSNKNKGSSRVSGG